MTARGSTGEPTRRLLGHWDRLPEFGEPVGCTATTYTFDAGFFEEECLARFAGIESDSRDDQQAYLVEREEKLSQLHASVLVDASHVPRGRSLRWNALPVALAGGGILHGKVSLLAWRNRIRLLVGSANLTEPGYRRNYELMAVLDFSPQGGTPLALLAQGIGFLRRVSELAPGVVSDGPRSALEAFLGRVEGQAAMWPDVPWPRGEPQASFISVLPRGPSLFETVARQVWGGAGPDLASVLSPFYDEGEGAREVVDALVGIMGFNGTRTIEFLAPGRKHPDGAIEIDLPMVLRNPWGKRRAHVFGYVLGRDASDESRDLHAKSLWLERGDRGVYVVGSSNFTRAGTGVGRGPVNVEANVAYLLPQTSSTFGKACREACPPFKEIEPGAADTRFLEPTAERTPDATTSEPLPGAFGLALYRAGQEGPRVELAIGKDAPERFDVLREDGVPIAGHESWTAAGRRARFPVAWPLARPPSCLLVRWFTKGSEPRHSIWPVNVADPAELPPPDELRSLDLEELLEILTSAKPLHEAVAMVLRRRAARQAQLRGPLVDPHRKVDTRNFLLRRVRRVSEALECLRERLERPAFGLEGLHWRLYGPIGPLALARRLAEQEGQGAGFMIAEVALTLRQANWSEVERGLGRSTVQVEVFRVIEELNRLADTHPAPRNLAHYVEECFAGVRA